MNRRSDSTTFPSRTTSLALFLVWNQNFVENYLQRFGDKIDTRTFRRWHFWGAQAASLQVSAACRDREPGDDTNRARKDVAGRSAGNYRLAACGPQKCPRQDPLITSHRSPRNQGLGAGVGRGRAVGPGLGVGVILGVVVGVGVALGVKVAVAVGVAVGVTVEVGVELAVGVGVGVDPPDGNTRT